jgi:hypothetical protein
MERVSLSRSCPTKVFRAACREAEAEAEAVASVRFQAGRSYLSPLVEMFQGRAFGGPIVVITLSLSSGYGKVPAKSVRLSSPRSLARILLRSTSPSPH